MHRVAIGLCLATALGVSLAAQAGNQAPPAAGQQPPSTTQQPPSTPAQPPRPATPSSTTAASPGEMTLTGCLAKDADGDFTLTNVQADSRASSGGAAAPTGTAGATTPGAASSSAAGASATWNLKGGSDLANHVGHRIAVTGKAAAAASGAAGSTPGATTAPPATTTAGASASSSSARTLEVASVKMIAATCP